MSLVNDTLQDLENRRGDESLARYGAVNVKVGRAEKPAGAGRAILLGLAMGALALGVYLFQSATETDNLDTQTAHLASTVNPPVSLVGGSLEPINSPEPIDSLKPIESSEPTAGSELEAVSSESLVPEFETRTASVTEPITKKVLPDPSPKITQENSELAIWLNAAQQALTADRLLIPDGDNAFFYFQQVLTRQPDHPEALNGIDSIAQRYAELAAEEQGNGNSEVALRLARRGLSVSPTNQALLQLRAELNAELAAAKSINQTETPVEAKVEKVELVSSAVTEASTVTPQAQPDQVLPEQSGQLTVQPSNSGLDQRRAEAALGLAQQGEVEQAIRDLEMLKDASDLGYATTRALANLYLQAQQPSLAKNLAEQQTVLPEVEAAYIVARSQMQSNNLGAALVTLEANQPDMRRYPDYYALLAGIYQQGGQNQLAANLYRRLTRLQPQQFAHWLGLAVSLDKLQQPDALLAFQQLLPMLSEQQGSLRLYVSQRIAALTNKELGNQELSNS